ncbi:MAG: galactose mutarotase [Spirosomaceae bacterium]|nr:galactose mutarotase [Spirosomataceae bacterium]
MRKSTITSNPYGTTKTDSVAVELYTLKNTNGMTVKITNYGGTIVSWTAPDSAGNYEDIVLGMDDLKGYLDGVPYFGALIGRYGNRIAKGKFKIDGEEYNVPVNNGENALHGGIKGFDKVVWTATPLEGEEVGLKLNYISNDGEEGYPGKLSVEVIYTLQNDNSLKIDYQATTDKPTVVNLTNHTYFNLTGNVKRDVLEHEVMIAADRFLPVDKGLIPTGELRSVKGTPFDFTELKSIGERINDTTNTQIILGGGYDHAWVFTDESNKLKSVAKVVDPSSKRTLEVLTTEPAVQFYTGNFLDGTLTGKNGTVYNKRCGFCLETQHYPDAPNQPEFPSTTLLPGETYTSTTVYKFGVRE